jgi:hypothetical protein
VDADKKKLMIPKGIHLGTLRTVDLIEVTLVFCVPSLCLSSAIIDNTMLRLAVSELKCTFKGGKYVFKTLRGLCFVQGSKRFKRLRHQGP